MEPSQEFGGRQLGPGKGSYFSTDWLPSKMRKDAWIDTMTASTGRFDIEFPDGEFHGSVQRRRIGKMICQRISQSSRANRRSNSDCERSDPGYYHFLVQLAGRHLISQAGKETLLRPGDATLIHSGRPTVSRFSGKATQVVIHIPRRALTCTQAQADSWLAVRMRNAAPLLMVPLVQAAFELGEVGNELYEEAVQGSILALINAACGAGYDEARPQVTRKREIVPSIREFIVANLSNPDLSPASIAEAIGISERQVHRAFKGSDTSVSRTIKRQRLDGAAAQLRSLGADRSITDVAFGVGFNELAHFSRAFREQFGQSPSDYRDAWIAGTEKA